MGLHRKSYDIATVSNSIDIDNVSKVKRVEKKKADEEVKNKFITLSRRKCLIVFISISVFSLLIIAAIVVTVTVLLMNNDVKVSYKNNSGTSNSSIKPNITPMTNIANLSYFMDLVGKSSENY